MGKMTGKAPRVWRESDGSWRWYAGRVCGFADTEGEAREAAAIAASKPAETRRGHDAVNHGSTRRGKFDYQKCTATNTKGRFIAWLHLWKECKS
jgi:hypothetical protein